MKRFRKYCILLLMLGLAATPLLITVQFIVKRQMAEYNALEQLEQGNYKTYTFPMQQVQWVKEGKELLVDGKLFDVKSWRKNAENIEVAGMFDEEENDLLEKYKNLVNNKQGNSAQDLQFLKMLFTPFVTSVHEPDVQQFRFLSTINYRVFNENAVSKSYSIVTPPPRYIPAV